MKSFSLSKILAVLVASTALTTLVFAHDGHKKTGADADGSLIKIEKAGVSAEWLAQAKAGYPSDSCPVSADKLEGGDMGPPQDYVYREEGKPDRLVRLCCNHCVRDFKKEPAKFLKMLDDAAAAKAKAAPEHQHKN
ncbi:MAG: hypothetical protein ACOZE5_03035 [Verrucomicrobiota bacterium]